MALWKKKYLFVGGYGGIFLIDLEKGRDVGIFGSEKAVDYSTIKIFCNKILGICILVKGGEEIGVWKIDNK